MKIKKFADFSLKLNENNEAVPNTDVINTKVKNTDTTNTSDKVTDEDEYIGTKLMDELAAMFGVDIIDNTTKYKGKVINFYSETEKFNVNGRGFDTPQEVYDFLNGKYKRKLIASFFYASPPSIASVLPSFDVLSTGLFIGVLLLLFVVFELSLVLLVIPP